MSAAQTILVFSDPHGRIPLLLRLVWQWQRENDRQVDLILVAGDLGIWPDNRRLDSSTRKYSQTDPSELGFQAFAPAIPVGGTDVPDAVQQHLAQAHRLLDQILPEIEARIVFVGGNHEDYDYLADCRKGANNATSSLVPVEASGRICWIPPGQVYQHSDLTITGISGIDAASCGRDPGRYHPDSVITDDSVIDATLNVLESYRGRPIDVLLTHDGLPDAAKPGKGTLKLLEVIDALNPRYHFFGHYHSQIDPLTYASWVPQIAKWHPQARQQCADPSRLRTVGIHVNKLAFDRRTDVLRPHNMGLLHVEDAEQHRFEFVQADWLSTINGRTMWKLQIQ